MAPPPPPALPDELVEEIFLRLPPDDPACLLRSSLVSKAWSGAVSGTGFRRRLHDLHGAAPVLGLLASERTPCFIPTTASPFSLADPDRRSWLAIDCRHGRALFLPKRMDGREFLVWEPITGAQHRVPMPAAFERGYSTAAVLCAADGCDHRDCLGGPFRVLSVSSSEEEDTGEYGTTSACVYSSETGAWGEPTSTRSDIMEVIQHFSVLGGSSLLYFIFYDDERSGSILEYDLSVHSLTVFSAPDNHTGCLYGLLLTEDGGLGVIQDLQPHLKLWTREASDGAGARWVLSRVIHLGNLLPASARLNEGYGVLVVGSAEGANVIFISTIVGLFAIELQSEQVRKLCDDGGFRIVVPVVTFYTPVPRGHHQNLLASKPGEEAGGVEEKTVNQAQQLSDHGCNAIKEVDFVDTFENHQP